MNVIRRLTENTYGRSPFQQLEDLRNEFNRFFESPLDLPRSIEFFNCWVPTVDLFEDTENFYVQADMPGMKREDIELCLHDGALTISGERKRSPQAADTSVYRSERTFGRFQRVVSLPKPVLADKVSASYQDGILRAVLPKTVEAKPRQIHVTQC
jgi:HSP20 family protein